MIKRKDGRWQEQIKLPGMEKPKYFYGRTQREVQRKLAAWSMEREQEQATQISVVVEQWAERHQEEISASSWQSYPAAVRGVLQWFQGREIGDVYPYEITDFLQAIAARGYSRRTVQRRRDVLTLVWDYAIERRLARYNAARQARPERKITMKKFEGLLRSEIKKVEKFAQKRDGYHETDGAMGFITVKCEICSNDMRDRERGVTIFVYVPDRRRSFICEAMSR